MPSASVAPELGLNVPSMACGRVKRRLHADDLDGRVDMLGRDSDAGNHAAAADGHDQCFKVRRRFENFQPHRALPGDNQRVVEGRDQCQTLSLDQVVGMGLGVVECLAVQDHFRAHRLGAFDLGEGRGLGHDDDGRDSQPLRMERHALCMVAGGTGHDAFFRLFLA